VPFAVGSYITAAYWFTASTSFANPAATLARALRTHSQASGRLMFPDASSPSSRAQLRLRYLFRWLVPSLPKVAPKVVVEHSEPESTHAG
jgi:hypothetical protein